MLGPLARFALVLTLGGCAASFTGSGDGGGGDGGTSSRDGGPTLDPDASVEGRDGGPDAGPPGTCGALDLPDVGLGGERPGGPVEVTTVADGVVTVASLESGAVSTFRVPGLDTSDLRLGATATYRQEAAWQILEVASGPTFVAATLSERVGPNVLTFPIRFASARLVPACTGPDPMPLCRQPPNDLVEYALDLGGAVLQPGEVGSASEGLTVSWLGALQLPGYFDGVCIGEADFRGAVALRIERERRTCLAIEAAYEALLEDNSACGSAAECQVLLGQCGVGLGGCYEPANRDVQSELDALGEEFAATGCTAAVCDCAGPPRSACVEGHCAFRR